MQEKRKGPPRTGQVVLCNTCGAEFYKKRSRLLKDKLHFCSEPCRIAAISANVIDRKVKQASQKKRNGKHFECCICGETVYRKASYIARGIDKTCGSAACLSAYGRRQWGLSPLSEAERITRKTNPRKHRGSYFSDAMRASWIADQCAMCGATDNLCLDHIVPIAAGGKSIRSNAQTLCRSCNARKSMSSDIALARTANGSS